MDINLILSAQTLTLAPEIKRSQTDDGLIVLKNVPAKTYLTVTVEQWRLLTQFEKPRMVPAVLGDAIRDRQCLPLGEFYELILKAMKADILLEPESSPEQVTASDWSWKVRPSVLERPLVILFCVGLVMSLLFHPKLPTSVFNGLVGLAILSAALSLGELLAACMLRGSGGEVYRPRWNWFALPPHMVVDKSDAVLLPSKDQSMIVLAVPTVVAAAAGVSAWHWPEWSFFSLVGLVYTLRPILGGKFASRIQIGGGRAPSDAEHDFIFPPNRQPQQRIKLLRKAISHPNTWARLAYGVAWTLAILYWGARLTELPPWSLDFWRTNGLRIAIASSLTVLGASYASWEIYHWGKDYWASRSRSFELWRNRWFGDKDTVLDESARHKLVTACPLFSALTPPQRLELARSFNVRHYGPWKNLMSFSGAPKQVALIVSGKMSLRRELKTGRTTHLQSLCEGDIIGLHDLADPKFPNYRLRTMTPVTLMTLDRDTAEKLVVARLTQTALTDNVLKLPFLRSISLCRNWHLQAINRFARLSTITDYPEGEVILSEGRTVEDFFVIFQGNATVSSARKALATISASEFFGEIGLMQNSSPNASVTAKHATRCLRIPRIELMRFVTHNYTVALELERVSSERLGRPIFPLKTGDFRTI